MAVLTDNIVDTHTTVPGATATTRTTTVPATAEDGDILVVWLSWPSGAITASLSSPGSTASGLTELSTLLAISGSSSRVFKKVVTASADAGTVITGTWSSSATGGIGCFVLSGEIYSDIAFGASGTHTHPGSPSGSNNMAALSAVTSVANQIKFGIIAINANPQPSSTTVPAGWTKVVEAYASGNGGGIVIAADFTNTAIAAGATVTGDAAWVSNAALTANMYLLLATTKARNNSAGYTKITVNTGGLTAVGAADLVTALSDGSDSSYATATPGIGSGAVIAGKIKWLSDGSMKYGARLSTGPDGGAFTAIARLFQQNAANTTARTQIGTDTSLGTISSSSPANYYVTATAGQLAAITNRALLIVEIEMTVTA